MDVDTQTRITTLYKPFHPASYLCHHTPLLTPKHTNTPPDRRAGKEGSQYLKSYLALWLQIRLLLWPMGKLWSLLQGTSLRQSRTVVFITSLHLIRVLASVWTKEMSDLAVTLYIHIYLGF